MTELLRKLKEIREVLTAVKRISSRFLRNINNYTPE